MKKGGFTFVLHSHLPYCRLAGRWPHGEEWIHEAAAETYVPLLNAFFDLKQEGVLYKTTIGITPILTEQLADPLVLAHFEEYLHEKVQAANQDIARFSQQAMFEQRLKAKLAERAEAERHKAEAKVAQNEPPKNSVKALLKTLEAKEKARSVKMSQTTVSPNLVTAAATTTGQTAEPDLAINPDGKPDYYDDVYKSVQGEKVGADQRFVLAQFYRNWYSNILDSFVERYNRDIVGAFKVLQDAGLLEIITCAATHGYLPLVARDSTIYAQLKVGIDSYKHHYGRAPRAIWLPECAYRPAYYEVDENGERYYKPGIEEFLAEQGIGCFFVETHTIEGGMPVGKAAEEVVGPYSYIQRRYVVPASETLPATGNSTQQPYWVQRPDVAVMGRNNRIGMQVWSGKYGYPGEKDYREFHKKDSGSGLQYWRITGSGVELGDKEYYHPEWAEYRIHEHSEHFAKLVEEMTTQYYDENGKIGIIDANYDTELFGHWWFEGVEWIKQVLKRLAQSETVQLTTASDWIEQHPPETVLAIPESSWGQQGTHFVWLNTATEWMWPLIHGAERHMEKLVALYPEADKLNANTKMVLEQAARELLLLESSDWPFLVTTGQARDYAEERFNSHLERFNKLAQALEAAHGEQVDVEIVSEAHQYFELDNPFPNIDWAAFANRELVGKQQ